MSLSFLPLDRTPMFTHPRPDHFYMPPIDDQHFPHTASSQSQPTFPKLGQTRCYWALLNPGLQFLYVDPVLHSHLGSQADAIIGKRLLEFVHPDEHASAQQDLGKVLESRTLHGSVTRVRYSRLGRTRARLGYTGPPDTFQDEDKVSFDENYMACDLVINWAAEGLVLCFIHAVTDMSPHDNDEHNPTNWTNWCGTPEMDDQDGVNIYRALLRSLPQNSHGAGAPTRVFQILKNSMDRSALFSWPAQGYLPGDYGQLANDVQIGGANGSDAKTSCTRRYKALQTLHSADGSAQDAESIFIPHGRIIFACHKTVPHRPRGHPTSYPPMYQSPQNFYEPPGQIPYCPTVPSQLDYAGYSGYAYAYAANHRLSKPYNSSSALESGESPSSDGVRGHSSYSWPASSAVTPSAPYSDHSPQGSQSHLPDYIDEVPPPRQRGVRLTPEAGGGSSRDSNAGRLSGHPPTGVMRCAACKSTSSPEWRKGPSGKKDLCNACGLRYSRAKAKKDGVPSQRRRKEPLKVPSQMPEELDYNKRQNYPGTSRVEFSAEEQRVDATGGINYPKSPSPSPPRDHPYHHPHHPTTIHSNSALYGYSPLDSRPPMYMASTHLYPHHHHHHPAHQAYHDSPDGFLSSTSSPAPGDFTASSSTGLSSTGLSAPMSSYERTGMPPEPHHHNTPR